MKSWRWRLTYAAGWVLGIFVAVGLALLFCEFVNAVLDCNGSVIR